MIEAPRASADEGEARSGSLLPVLLFLAAAIMLAVVATIITMGFAAVFMAVAAAVLALIALQYFVWGRWLRQAIESEESAEAELKALDPGDLPVKRDRV